MMSELRSAGSVIAIVVDEFGGAEGIVTIEDIMEEVVEDLEDEYDGSVEDGHWIRRLNENEFLVSARVEVGELNEKLQIELPEGRYVTLAGLILDRTHKVPKKGHIVKEGDISLVIHRSTAQAILEVRIHW